jgi:N-acetylglutamate synthase-like GNAT family acetyltransferase
VLRSATRDDLHALRALLAHANDAPYDLAAVAEEKCFGRGFSGEPLVRVFGDFDGVAVTCGKYLRILAVDRAKRRRGIGSGLLADAVARGARIAFAEPGNYFLPGVLDPSFFIKHGWRKTASTQNLETTSLPGEIPPGVTRATHARRDEILAFIEREFGRIWRFEVTPAFDRDVPPLFITEEDDGTITGFAAHDVNNRSLGFFGPTGVASAQRGRGVGRRLLLASLADLRAMGFSRVVIPWTDAIAFYEKSCGAVVGARFVTMALR